jgi:hypothetical protein
MSSLLSIRPSPSNRSALARHTGPTSGTAKGYFRQELEIDPDWIVRSRVAWVGLWYRGAGNGSFGVDLVFQGGVRTKGDVASFQNRAAQNN